MYLLVLRGIGAVIAGLLLGGIAIALLEGAGHLVFPPPPGLDPTAADFSQRVINEISLGAKWTLLLGNGIGVLTACAIAARLAPAYPWLHGGIVGLIFFLAAIGTMIFIPHPVWVMAVAGLMYPVATFAGCSLGAAKEEAPEVKG